MEYTDPKYSRLNDLFGELADKRLKENQEWIGKYFPLLRRYYLVLIGFISSLILNVVLIYKFL